jgi:hypothetical protein
MFKPFFKEFFELSPFLKTGKINAYKRNKNSPSKPDDEEHKSNGKEQKKKPPEVVAY